MHVYIEILRPYNGLMAAVAVTLGAYVAGASGGMVTLAALIVFLITGAGMVINDYFDRDIDKINRPDRPIPSGRISPKNAAAYSGALFGAGIGLTLFFNPYVTGLAVLNSIIEVFYAHRFKGTPLFGNVLVSWLVGSTYIFGGLLTGNLGGPVILGTVAFFANLAREVYKASADYKGDRAQGARTIAVLIGRDEAKRLGDVLAVVASIVSIAVFALGVLGPVYLVVQMAAVAVYASALRADEHGAERLAKIGMAIGLAAIAADLGSGILVEGVLIALRALV